MPFSRQNTCVFLASFTLFAATTAPVFAGDWPQHGRTNQRNMISDETGLPDSFDPGSANKPAENLKWKVSFDGTIYSVPIVSGGKVFMAAAAAMDDPKYPPAKRKSWKKGSLFCFEEKTGKPLWKYTSNEEQKSGSTGRFGMTTAPVVEKDRLYVYGGNHFVFCMTTDGLGAGNIGPITNEEELYKIEKPFSIEDQDADMVWQFTNRSHWKNLLFHNAYAFSPLVEGDYIYASTGNGAVKDFEYKDTNHPPRKNADVPTLMVLNKKNGRLVAYDEELMGRGMIHGSWGTPCLGIVKGKKQILFGGSNGVIYSFDPQPEQRPGKPGVLKKIWSFDPNAWLKADRRFEIFGAPVCVDNKVYATVSDDWTHAKVPGILVCIDAAQTGDITQTGLVWQYRDIGISNGTVAISKGLIYATDLNGRLHCIDKETGKAHWVFQSKGDFRANAIVAEGKVYVGNKRGEFFILQDGKTLNVLHQTQFPAEISGSCTVANGTVYVSAGDTLYAFQK